MLLKTLLATLVFVPVALAFFRLPCDNVLVHERADPIVSPGKVAGHAHTVSGGSGFSLNSTYDDLRASECTSCRAKADLSAYWTPQLYLEFANGTFASVEQVGGGLIYYLYRTHPTDKTKLLAFPKGLKMLVGDPMRRTYNESRPVDQAIGWNCLGGSQPTRKPELPSENCPNGLRGEIRFPSCWNGVDLYKTDQSHMSYPIGGEAGHEIMWSIDPLAKAGYFDLAKTPKSPFVLANGDPTGYGYHGDFQNGWNVDVLQQAADICTNDSGVIEECPVLELYDRATEGYCRKVVLGNLDSLPGCNPVTKTAAKAKKGMSSCPNLATPALLGPSTAYTGKYPPPGATGLRSDPITASSSNGYKYQGCYLGGSDRGWSKQLSLTKKTVKECLSKAKAEGYTYVGIEYGGECWVGTSLAPSTKEIDYGKCDMTCRDEPNRVCGGPAAMTLYKLASPARARSRRHQRALRHT
ncbi:hypothetical protein Rhopal_007778-T1 [Rhodotorula paludigena]|uniref:WSC domain-containing protein n=1 Tax=Rhodotorula paludigena TaxID=86838 RepID=A0AAV5H0C9_9BASI|nr:hypothetical protein Rhopal_007778-T1 [Rhodotorula paludigena]